MPGFNDIHKFINVGLWPELAWPGPMNLLETDLRDVQDFVLFTNNEYLLVSVTKTFSIFLSLSLSRCCFLLFLFSLSFRFTKLAKVIKTR